MGKRAKMLVTLLLMLVAVGAVTFGDILMAQAMKGLGPVDIDFKSGVLGAVKSIYQTWFRVFTTPKVWGAIGCMATFFFIWQAVLSWADLTYVLPLTALTYVLNGFLAGPFLGESVTPARWAGIVLIAVGVGLVAFSESQKGP